MMRWVLLLLALASPLRSADGAGHTRASLHVETPSVAPGQTLWAAVRLDMDPGWHTYWKDPGDSGMATRIRWQLPEGFVAGEILWPRPEVIKIPPLTDYGYHGEALLLVPLTAPDPLPGKEIRLSARVDWLECKEICVPGKAELSLTLPVSSAPTALGAESARLFERARSKLPAPGEDPYAFAQKPAAISGALALLFAFLGGLLLNLMPCVLPVLSIKVLGFLKEAGPTGRRNAWLYAAGVVVSFWILAGGLLALRAAGQPLGWGFQLQSPIFVTILILLFFVLGLSLLGVFEVGTSFIGLASFAGKSGALAAFSSGALAVAVATPCTAPLMGPAIGFAVTQPPLQSLGVFTSLALGLALPYVLLAHFPAALRWVPKPGPWMLTLKQFMAFLFFATCLWLLWVLGLQGGVNALLRVLVGLWALAVAAWVYGPLRSNSRNETRRKISAGIAFVLFLIGVVTAFPGSSREAIAWESYSEERLAEARAQGAPVFVDFTAAWCLTCQVNERTTLSARSVEAALKENNVVALKADWTNRDPVITAALERHGRSGVPLYVFYPAGQDPVLLPALLKPNDVINAVKGESK
jgi:thiol:disulfide interchange protein